MNEPTASDFPSHTIVSRMLALLAEARRSGYLRDKREYLHVTEEDYARLRDEAIAYSTSHATYTTRDEYGWTPSPYPTPSMYFAGVPVYPDRDVAVTYVGCEHRIVATLDPLPEETPCP